MSKLQELQDRIGYTFEKEGLLRQALTHSSYANEKHMKKHSDNERLEFLGDAVLEIASSDFLYRNYPDLPEGDLTKLRASIVCEPTLALCTREMELGGYLLLGKGENQTGGRKRKSILSDVEEPVRTQMLFIWQAGGYLQQLCPYLFAICIIRQKCAVWKMCRDVLMCLRNFYVESGLIFV